MFLSRLMKNRKMRSGQAIVIIALSMAVLLAIVALGIDGSKFYSERRVTQNAADELALAGVYIYENNPTYSDVQVLDEINRVAQLDQIPDTLANGAAQDATADTATTSDGDNPNVTAEWLDTNGNLIQAISNCNTAGVSTCWPPGTTSNPGTAAVAIKVTTSIPYATFLGGFVGHPNVTAIADASARIVKQDKTFTDNPYSAWAGGPDCIDLADLAFSGAATQNMNNVEFHTGAYIDGSLDVGDGGNVQNTLTGAAFTVRTWASNNKVQAIPTKTTDPFPFKTGSAYYTGPNDPNPYSANNGSSSDFPQWTHFKFVTTQTDTLLDAKYFEPDSSVTGSNFPSGVTGNWYFQFYKNHYQFLGNIAPVNFFHYINTGSATGNDALLQADITAGQTGIFYVDGDLQTSNGSGSGKSVTLIVAGKLTNNGANGTSFGSAGDSALNISILAGGSYASPQSKPSECANDASTAIVTLDGNQIQFDGIIYVPHGQLAIGGNWNSGNGHTNGPIVSYSFSIAGANHPANNEQLDFGVSFGVPQIIVQLMGNG